MNIKIGDVVIADLPSVGGSVQSGKHHCIVVQNDKWNKFSPTTQVVSLTTRNKKQIETHLEVMLKNGRLNTVLCEQVITINKKAITEITEHLDDDFMTLVDEKLKLSLGLTWATHARFAQIGIAAEGYARLEQTM